MAKTECKYGIFFPEHTGYLYVRRLAPGNEGGVALVRSITDGMQCVRKNTHPQDRKDSETKIAEVQYHRPHPLIPSLIWSHDHRVLNIDHKEYDTFKSTTMIHKYCNGGTLYNLVGWGIIDPETRRLPEALIWRMLDHRIQTWLYMINSDPSTTRLDCHMNNVFLHFEDGAKLPDFYTGDLGHAKPIDPIIFQAPSPDFFASTSSPTFRRLGSLDRLDRTVTDPSKRESLVHMIGEIASDFRHIWWSLVALMFRIDVDDHDPDDEDMRDNSKALQEWSPELFECEEKIRAIKDFFDTEEFTLYNELQAISHEISVMARRSARADPGADLTSYLRERDTYSYEGDVDESFLELIREYRDAHSPSGRRPCVFNSRVPLLQLASAWPEPWRIARIEENTGRVLGVEKMSYSFNRPEYRDGASNDPRYQHVAQSESLRIGLDRIQAAATVAETTTHKVQEDFALLSFVRGEDDDPNDDDIFGLDPEWTEERLAGPLNTSPAQSPEGKASLKRPLAEGEGERQTKRQRLINEFFHPEPEAKVEEDDPSVLD